MPKLKMNGTIRDANATVIKEVNVVENTAQQQVNRYIEILFARLTAKADVKQFEQIIKNNVQAKKSSAKDEVDYFDRLMLNITYFVENKAVWNKMMQETYGRGQVPKISYIESETMAQQMRIRQAIGEKMNDYTKLFHSQYKALQVTEEDVVYDYAYASVEHSLRYDFLTYVTIQKDVQELLAGEFEETLRVIDGYVAYHADQAVNQMALL
ncbi:DNA helicase [Lysinibacillus odysseyi]|uniref:DNA helicase n=1 Tax=Lysinibacillus odysseyi TaxID=202611 RepID=UPI001FD4206D|nr:DNA helicase [Lysinibacillus odysseyi]